MSSDQQVPAGGSVRTTALVTGTTTTGIAIAMYLVHPSWPPPDTIIDLAVGYLAPVVHLIGRAAYRKLARWAGEPADAPAPAAAPLAAQQ